MTMKSGPLQLKGSVYLVARAVLTDPGPPEVWTSPTYLQGTKVGRLEQVASFRMARSSQIGRKVDDTPTWTRINGDWMEAEFIITDFTDEFMDIATQLRGDDDHFAPGDGDYVNGHLLRDEDYYALMIRDENAPLEYPACYIPYCFTSDVGWFIHRGAMLQEMCELSVIGVWPHRHTPPYEFGNITKFAHYVAEEEEEEGGGEEGGGGEL